MSPKITRPFTSFLGPHLNGYLEYMVGMGYSSFGNSFHRSLARDFDHYLLFRFIAAIKDVDEGFVSDWMHAVPGFTASTKNQKLRFARGFLRHLVGLDIARDNPAERIPYLKFTYPRPYIYTLQEIHGILQEAEKHKQRHPEELMGWTLPTVIFLIYACGLRISEALNLAIRDVDFEENTLSLWGTKFHKERVVPFSPATAKKLSAYLAVREKHHPSLSDEEPFFRSRSGKYHRSTIERHFKIIIGICGLKSPAGRGAPCIHGLRHAFAVHRLYKWYQEGCDPLNKLPLLSTYMGHVNIEATQVYLTITQALLREGDRRFQAGFEGVTDKALKRALGKP